MQYPVCALVLLGALRGMWATSSQHEQEKRDLEKYALEASKKFNALPGWIVGKEDALYSTTPFETYHNRELKSDYDKLIFYPEESVTSASEMDLSEDLEHPNVKIPSKSRALTSTPLSAPFSIEEEGLSESNKSDGCLRDRDYIVELFRKCIYQQEEQNPGKNMSVLEETRYNYYIQFLKHCRKTPQLRACIKETIIKKLQTCPDEGMYETIDNVEEVTASMIRFICVEEADRISILIADGGFHCPQFNSVSIIGCLGANLATRMITSLFYLPSLPPRVGTCQHLQLAEECVEQQLEFCKNRAVVTFAAVLFNIAKEVASCEDMSVLNATQPSQLPPNSTTLADIEFVPELHVEANGHEERKIMDTGIEEAASDYVLSTTEKIQPNPKTSTPHVHTCSIPSNTQDPSRNAEIIISVLICALAVLSVLGVVASRRLLKIRHDKRHQVKVLTL